MPHKRNPTTSERLCGLARLLRGYAGMMLENVALWHERDLSHSSVERVVLPDAMIAAHYQVTSAADLVRGLAVYPGRMRDAIEATNGLAYSSAVLADLLEGGSERESTYRMIQDAANGEDFLTLLRTEGIEAELLSGERFLVNHDVIYKRLENLRGLEY
jgi:adenylosuccinate lyase